MSGGEVTLPRGPVNRSLTCSIGPGAGRRVLTAPTSKVFGPGRFGLTDTLTSRSSAELLRYDGVEAGACVNSGPRAGGAAVSRPTTRRTPKPSVASATSSDRSRVVARRSSIPFSRPEGADAEDDAELAEQRLPVQRGQQRVERGDLAAGVVEPGDREEADAAGGENAERRETGARERSRLPRPGRRRAATARPRRRARLRSRPTRRAGGRRRQRPRTRGAARARRRAPTKPGRRRARAPGSTVLHRTNGRRLGCPSRRSSRRRRGARGRAARGRPTASPSVTR